MPLQFYDGKKVQRRIEILKIPPRRFVQFLAYGDGVPKLKLHYIDGDSKPCLGSECRYCHLEARLYAYAPVIQFQPNDVGSWIEVKAILPIPEFTFDLAERDNRNEIIKVSRQGDRKNGRMLWETHKLVGPSKHETFDVLQMMLARWKILPSTQPTPTPPEDDDQGTLPFPEVG